MNEYCTPQSECLRLRKLYKISDRDFVLNVDESAKKKTITYHIQQYLSNKKMNKCISKLYYSPL